MDDKPVFNDPQSSQNPPPQPADENGRLTLNDLYGPSNPQDLAQIQPPAPTQPTNEPLPPQPAAPQPVPEVIPPQVIAEQPQMQPQYPSDQPVMQPGGGSDIPPAPPPPPFPPTSFPFTLLANPKAKLFLSIGGILLLLIIFIILFGLTKGGGVGSQKATLTYWGLWDDSKIIQPIIDDFQRDHPNITVVYKKEDSKQYKQRLTTRINNNTGPDIYTYHNSWLPTIINSLAPLPSDAITKDEFKQYFPVVQQDLTANGAIYGLPQGIDTLSLFVNKEIFDAAGLNVPENWEEFVKAAKSLTVKDPAGKIKTAGAALGTFDNINHSSDIVSLIMVNNNVDLNKFAGQQQNLTGALSYYASYATDANNVWNDTIEPSLLAFSNGQIAMYFGYSWDIFQIKATNPNLKFEVHPVPNIPKRKATIASYWVTGVSSKSSHQKEAMLFMHYLAQKDVQQKIYTSESKTRLFGTPYARADLAKGLESNPIVAPFVQQAPFAVSTYFASDTHDTEYNDRLNAYLGNAVRAVDARNSAESAASTLIQGVTQVRSQFGLQ